MKVTSEVQELTSLLLKGTRGDKFAWRSTSQAGVYRLVTPSGYIHITNDGASPTYGIGVFDADGAQLIAPVVAVREECGPLADLYEEVSSRLRQRGIASLMQELRSVMEGKPPHGAGSGGAGLKDKIRFFGGGDKAE